MNYDNSAHEILWIYNGSFASSAMRNLESYFIDTGSGELVIIVGEFSDHFKITQLYRADKVSVWSCTSVYDLTEWIFAGVHSETDGSPAAVYSVDTDNVISIYGLTQLSYGIPSVWLFVHFNGDTDWEYCEYEVGLYNITSGDFGPLYDPGDLYLNPCSSQEHDQSALSTVVGLIENYPSSDYTFVLWNYIYDFSGGLPDYNIDFYGVPVRINVNDSVTFTYSGDVIPGALVLNWSYGDGSYFSTALPLYEPIHQYNSSGWYNVTLNVSSSFGDYTETKIYYIYVGNVTAGDVNEQIGKIVDGIVYLLIFFLPAMLLGMFYGRLGVIVGLSIMATVMMFYDSSYALVATVLFIGLAALYIRGE